MVYAFPEKPPVDLRGSTLPRYNRTCEFPALQRRNTLNECRRGRESPGGLSAFRVSTGAAGSHPAGLGISSGPAGFHGGGQLLSQRGRGRGLGGGSGPVDHGAARPRFPAGVCLRAFLCGSGLPGAGVAAGFARVAHGRAAGARHRRRPAEHGPVPCHLAQFPIRRRGHGHHGWCLVRSGLSHGHPAGGLYLAGGGHFLRAGPAGIYGRGSRDIRRDLREKLLYGPFGKRSAHTAAGVE